MDYQKKYESVMDRLQGLIANAKKQGHILVSIEDIENTIPELQESEDEKIIKWIRKEIETKYLVKNRVTNVYADEALSWLEKQSKTKSTWDDVDDKNILNAITYTVKNSGLRHCIGVSNEVMIDWLKSLKERIILM